MQRPKAEEKTSKKTSVTRVGGKKEKMVGAEVKVLTLTSPPELSWR